MARRRLEPGADKTTEELIHEAGLGAVVIALATKPELLAALVAHLGDVELLRHELGRKTLELSRLRGEQAAAAAARAPQLPPAMREADLTIPRPASELAHLLGVRRQSLDESAVRPNGRIERIEAVVPGSNARYLYRLRPGHPVQPQRAGESGAQAPHTADR